MNIILEQPDWVTVDKYSNAGYSYGTVSHNEISSQYALNFDNLQKDLIKDKYFQTFATESLIDLENRLL